MSGEPETRRSARATKGQHKALEQLDQPIEAPKKRGKKGKKALPEPEEPEEEPEEIIRCVCGATEQDEDSGEPWIACDQCSAWQHNICMGLSQFAEDVPDEYYCEQCRPENHKELLEGMARGEKPWEARRQAYEEESAKKKKKGPKKGKGKRLSDSKDDSKQSPAPESKKSKPSPVPVADSKKMKSSPVPVPEPKKAKSSPAPETGKKETKAAAATAAAPATKRKVRDESQDKEAKPSQKIRKVSETQAVPVPPAAPLPIYNAPADIPARILDLPEQRQGPAKALAKSLANSIAAAEKKGAYVAPDGVTAAAKAERLALEVERAVQDSHPNAGAYAGQVRTLVFNLKSNQELAIGLLRGTLTPPILAAMTTEELASKELQKETAEMKARAEKQSILINEEGPRVRRTHKGEEIVGEDSAVPTDEAPLSHSRRATIVRETQSESAPPLDASEDQSMDAEPQVELPAHIEQTAAPSRSLQINTQSQQSQPQHSPKTDFDINKVFSSVKSPTVSAKRRPSALPGPSSGPGIDPEVDRMLQDDGTESPPYSPTEESDPSVVWRGSLVMNTIAELPVVAKHVGGAKLSESIGLPWSTLIPKKLSVAGRIDETKATEYLCSLRYNPLTDLVVVNLQPTSEAAKPSFRKIVDYFVSKKRYGVVGEKGVGQVRDTYLIPVLPGTGGHPEFILNLEDNFLPETRAEPMLLCVFVYRNDPPAVQRRQGSAASAQGIAQSPVVHTPTPPQPQAAFAPRHPSMSAPQFSPASPQGTFPPQNYPAARNSQTPVQPPHGSHAPQPAQLPPQPQPPAPPAADRQAALDTAAQAEGERIARLILGPLIECATVQFLLPHASRMQPKEWELVRDVYQRDPLTQKDLNHLSAMLAKESSLRNAERGPQQPGPPPQQPPQHHPQPAQHQPQPPQQQQLRTPPVQQTPIPPPPIPSAGGPPRQTPIPPPPIPGAGGPPRQTPIPPPPIPSSHAAPPAPTA